MRKLLVKSPGEHEVLTGVVNDEEDHPSWKQRELPEFSSPSDLTQPLIICVSQGRSSRRRLALRRRREVKEGAGSSLQESFIQETWICQRGCCSSGADCPARRHGPLAALQDRRLPGPRLGHRCHRPGRRRERWVSWNQQGCQDEDLESVVRCSPEDVETLNFLQICCLLMTICLFPISPALSETQGPV